MTFYSILFQRPEDRQEPLDAPDFFVDLNLDQVVDGITIAAPEYNLKPLFYAPLNDVDAVSYRQAVMRELEDKKLFEHIKSFALKMRIMREHLAAAEKVYYKYQKARWFLDAVAVYGDAVTCLLDDLSQMDLQSSGLLALREYLTDYIQSSRFVSLLTETKQLQTDLAAARYCLLIKGHHIRVRKYDDEIDYGVEVEATFKKFQQSTVEDYRATFTSGLSMTHVEARILDLVARLYADLFSQLDTYCATNTAYLDSTIGAFDRDIQFYVKYLEFIARLKHIGLKFCYPHVSRDDKTICSCEGFDLALAYKLLNENSPVVCNDFSLSGRERILVITGPNQGGKTTFARAFGQLHYLASLGCPVPGKEARLFLFDGLFTHFEKEEDLENLHGKLQDDLVRIRSILDQAAPNSLIVINEIFSSTTMQDAIYLSQKIMDSIIRLDALCACVTFIVELAFLGEKTVSMVSTVDPDNPTLRTYKLMRRPADGLAYAISLAEQYRLTCDQLQERIKS